MLLVDGSVETWWSWRYVCLHWRLKAGHAGTAERETHDVRAELGLHGVCVVGPPGGDVGRLMGALGMGGSAMGSDSVVPGLEAAEEVDDLDSGSVLAVGSGVGVDGGGGHVVGDGETARGVASAPGVAEEVVEESLVAAVEGSGGGGGGEQGAVGLGGGLENEEAGVEAVGPAEVGSGGELVVLEEFVGVGEQEHVGVEEDGLGVLGEPPAVELGEGASEVGTPDECEVFGVAGVESVDDGGGVEGGVDGVAHGCGDVGGEEAVELAGGAGLAERAGEHEGSHRVRIVRRQRHPSLRHPCLRELSCHASN